MDLTPRRAKVALVELDEDDRRDNALRCGVCGALNGRDFDRCIRCGAGLGKAAVARARLGVVAEPSRLLATKLIIAANVAVFVMQTWLTLERGGGFPLLSGGPEALRLGAMFVDAELLAAEPWRLVSATLVHFGLLHLATNMVGLASLGRAAEPAVGPARLVIAYVASGAAGFVASAGWALFVEHKPSFTAGASGAIFGVMGLVLGWLARLRDPRWKAFAVQAVVFSVLFGFAINASRAGIMVNNAAHLGGLAVGLVFGAAYARSNVARVRVGQGARPLGPPGLATWVVAAALTLGSFSTVLLAVRSPIGDALIRALDRAAAGRD